VDPTLRTKPVPSALPAIADGDRRNTIGIYLLLRGVFVGISLLTLWLAPQELNRNLGAEDLRRLWLAWYIFAGWSVPLAVASWWGVRRGPLAVADGLISLSLLPDSFAIWLAASATGGTASPVFRSIYFLIAIHAYHFSPTPWVAHTRLDRRGLSALVSGGAVSVACGMSVFCGLAPPGTPPVLFAFELGLQGLTATAFLLVRLSNLGRAASLAQSEEKLEAARQDLARAEEGERSLLKAMQDVSSIARISDQAQLDKRLRDLMREIGQNFACEFCALGLVREGKLEVPARHAAFPLSKKAKSALAALTVRSVDKGLVGSVLSRQRAMFRWSDGGRDLTDLNDDKLRDLGVSLDRAGTRRLRNEVLPSGALRHVLVAPFYSRDDEERPLGYILLLNRLDEERVAAEGFSEADEKRIRTLSDQLAVAITNFEHHRRDMARAEQEAFFNSLTLITDLDELSDRVLDYLNREYSSRVASLWFAAEDGFGPAEEALRVVLRSVRVQEMADGPGAKTRLEDHLKQLNVFRPGECFIGRFFRDQDGEPQVTYIEDLATVNDCWAQRLEEIGTPHLIVIPIRHYHEPGECAAESRQAGARPPLLGLACLRPRESFTFTDERRRALERFANHIAVLFEQTRFRQRYGQIEILKDSLSELQFSELSAFYAGLVRLVRDVLAAEACSFFALGPDGELVLKATTEEKAVRIEGGKRDEISTADYLDKAVYPAGVQSITAKITDVRKTVLIYDVHRSPHLSRLFMEVTESGEHHSLIGAPVLHTDGTLIGVLRCINKKKAGTLLPVFVQGDKEFLELVLGIMARFIENAESSASRRDFLNQLAHEIRSPLNSLEHYIDYMDEGVRRGRSVRKLEEQFDYLREQAGFIQFMVNDIQYQFGEGLAIHTSYDFSKAVDLRPMIERVKKLLLPTARQDRHIDIRTGTSRMPPLYVDPRRIQQVVFNLLHNAVKYSDKGGEEVFLAYDQIEESEGNATRSWHRISVRNWGIGVKESDLPFLFDEYRRGTNVEMAPSGTGLGLAVAKRIVEAHGGRLVVAKLRNPTIFAADLPEYLIRRPPSDENPAH